MYFPISPDESGNVVVTAHGPEFGAGRNLETPFFAGRGWTGGTAAKGTLCRGRAPDYELKFTISTTLQFPEYETGALLSSCQSFRVKGKT